MINKNCIYIYKIYPCSINLYIIHLYNTKSLSNSFISLFQLFFKKRNSNVESSSNSYQKLKNSPSIYLSQKENSLNPNGKKKMEKVVATILRDTEARFLSQKTGLETRLILVRIDEIPELLRRKKRERKTLK